MVLFFHHLFIEGSIHHIYFDGKKLPVINQLCNNCYKYGKKAIINELTSWNYHNKYKSLEFFKLQFIANLNIYFISLRRVPKFQYYQLDKAARSLLNYYSLNKRTLDNMISGCVMYIHVYANVPLLKSLEQLLCVCIGIVVQCL